jgi:thioredoxin-related protein
MKYFYDHNFVGYQKDSKNDILLFISINKKTKVAQICGWLPKETFLQQANFFDKGSVRTRSDGTSFTTMAPLYEIENNKLHKITSVEDLRKL